MSIIIPTKNSSRTIETCLQSIKQQTYSAIELIVVDNFSIDSTLALAKKFTTHVFSQGPERSAQRNFGVEHAQGEYVLIIDSDMVLEPQVVEKCVALFVSHALIKGIVIPEVSFGQGFRAQCKQLERSFYVGVDRMEAARCFQKAVYLEMWWYDEANIGTEDYDLPQRIQHVYGKECIGRIDAYIHHDEWTLSLWRTCHKKFYYGQRLRAYQTKEANQANFAQQASIGQRYALFLRSPRKLFARPLVWLGMLVMKTAEMASGACGYVRGKRRKVKNIY